MTDPAGDGGWRLDELRALVVNCTLKRSPEPSHTEGLIDRSRSIMERHGVAVEVLRRSTMTSPPAPGPGPSYLDPGSGDPENDFTNRNTTFATWNLMHLGTMLKRAGGLPAHGNQRSEWEAGCRFDADNPEHR
jgi:hypothetical protein